MVFGDFFFFFNEWLNDINKSLNSYKYFDIDTLDKLREWDLCDLGTSLIKLYKVVSISTSDVENTKHCLSFTRRAGFKIWK
jgi:hypothetical protein